MPWASTTSAHTVGYHALQGLSQATTFSSTQTTLTDTNTENQQVATSVVQLTKWERYPDPIAWTSSRDMIIVLENKYLFCVDIGRLEQYSITIREIFGIPQSVLGEGTETNPVQIPAILAEDFVLFLRWFNAMPGIDVAPIINERLLIGVIKICNPWLIAAGKRWAVDQLNILSPPLSPSRRLRLSRELDINIWVHDAVGDIMRWTAGAKRVRLITDDEINDVGTKAYSIIAKALESLQAEIILIAITPPTLPSHKDCISHQKCLEAWKSTWMVKIARKLLHPTDPTSISNLIQLIRETYFVDLNFECKLEAVKSFQQRDLFKAERMMIKAAGDSIYAEYGLSPDNVDIDD